MYRDVQIMVNGSLGTLDIVWARSVERAMFTVLHQVCSIQTACLILAGGMRVRAGDGHTHAYTGCAVAAMWVEYLRGKSNNEERREIALLWRDACRELSGE